MSSDDIDRYDLQTVMANTIVHSDNTGYGLLRERFDQNDFQVGALRRRGRRRLAGRMVSLLHAARLGEDVADVGAYVAEGQGNAPWLADVLQQTELSFLRTALGEGRRVLSKPGYEIDTPGTTWARSTMLASWSPILMFT